MSCHCQLLDPLHADAYQAYPLGPFLMLQFLCGLCDLTLCHAQQCPSCSRTSRLRTHIAAPDAGLPPALHSPVSWLRTFCNCMDAFVHVFRRSSAAAQNGASYIGKWYFGQSQPVPVSFFSPTACLLQQHLPHLTDMLCMLKGSRPRQYLQRL